MELEGEHRLFELLMVFCWIAVFWLQGRTIERRFRAGATWPQIRRSFELVWWAAFAVAVVSAFLWTERENQGWAHAMTIPQFLAIGFNYANQRLVRRLFESTNPKPMR